MAKIGRGLQTSMQGKSSAQSSWFTLITNRLRYARGGVPRDCELPPLLLAWSCSDVSRLHEGAAGLHLEKPSRGRPDGKAIGSDQVESHRFASLSTRSWIEGISYDLTCPECSVLQSSIGALIHHRYNHHSPSESYV